MLNALKGSETIVLNVNLARYDSRVGPVESTKVGVVVSPIVVGGENEA